MAPTHPPREPRIPGELVDIEGGDLAPGAVLHQARVTGAFTGQVAEDVELIECRVESARFTAAVLERAQVVDTVFLDCDLSGAVLYGASLLRVELRKCRLSALDLSAARLQDVRFVDCKLDEANLRMTKGTRVSFESSNLAGADFYESHIEHGALLDCDLRATEFSKAMLAGVRLRGSRLEGLRGARSLTGAVIDPTQIVPLALPLFGELGIVVETDAAE